MTKNRIFSALLAMIMLMGNAYAANPKREMRSTWFTTVLQPQYNQPKRIK